MSDDIFLDGGSGPLRGVRVVELTGIGPAPFCGMVLADLGADVVIVDRPEYHQRPWPPLDVTLRRGRRSVVLDLRQPEGVAAVRRVAAQADIFLEGFRPGVIERLGLGPDELLADNPRLVIGRMTGWGQDGPLAQRVGHDINYVAVSGTLAMIGRAGEPPVPPVNLLGDFGGGGMLLAVGVLAALVEARRSGQGQVVDAAMVDGAALLSTLLHGMRALGEWDDDRGTNMLDTGAPFYNVYETGDGGHVAVGAVEPRFFAELVRGLGLGAATLPAQMDRASWPRVRKQFEDLFRTKTLAEWDEIFDGTDACVTPVVPMGDAPSHPHLAHRGTFETVDGIVQPGPAPRFSRTPGRIDRVPPRPGQDTEEVLAEAGFTAVEIEALVGGATSVAAARG